jgi:hypothetical protein
LLGFGLGGGLVWAIVVGLSMPSWYEPDDSCARKFPSDSEAVVHTSWFPPSATCEFADGSRPYISTTTSVVLSVVAVLLLLLIATGLILIVRRPRGGPGPIRTAAGVALRSRRRSHLIWGTLDMGVAFAVITVVNAAAIIFGGLPGGILCIFTTLFGLSAFGALLDRHMGPLPSSTRDSRRRGTVAGLTAYGVVFAATAVSGQLPFFRLWDILFGGIAYAVIVAVQWSRATNNATQVQHSG